MSSRRSRCRPTRRYVKRFKFQSPSLTKFWGRPIYLGAAVLLPRDYDRADDGVPGQLHPGPLLARRALRVRRAERVLEGLAERRLPADDCRHLPAPRPVLRRLLRRQLGQRRPLRRRDHERADPGGREALPRHARALRAHPVGGIDRRLGSGRAADLPSGLLRRRLRLLPRLGHLHATSRASTSTRTRTRSTRWTAGARCRPRTAGASNGQLV